MEARRGHHACMADEECAFQRIDALSSLARRASIREKPRKAFRIASNSSCGQSMVAEPRLSHSFLCQRPKTQGTQQFAPFAFTLALHRSISISFHGTCIYEHYLNLLETRLCIVWGKYQCLAMRVVPVGWINCTILRIQLISWNVSYL